MSRPKEEIQRILNEKIPRSAVRERKGNANRTFSYLEGFYVINRLNEVLGIGGWSCFTQSNSAVWEGNVETNRGSVFAVSYKAVVRIEVPVLGTIIEGTGYGDGTDSFNPGKAHELAMKEAETDAFKRAARNLGMSMGLALYSKDQENVADADEPAPAPAPAPKSPKAAKAAEPAKPVVDRKAVNSLISATGEVITKRGLKSFAELKELMSRYGVQKKEELSDVQANDYLAVLQGIISADMNKTTQASA